MKNFFSITLLAFILVSVSFAQMPKEQPLGRDYIEYMKATNNGETILTTEDGKTLGFMPSPYPVSSELPIKTKRNKDAVQAPPSYDLRNVGGTSYVSPVKNQGSCGSCWAFAAVASIESLEMLLGLGTRDYSEQNVKNCHGFYWGHCSGGTEQIAAAYMVRNEGPYYETDDPYNIYSSTCSTGITPRTTYTDAWYLPNRRTSGYQDVLKDMIMEYGAVFTAMCWENGYWNSTTRCYNYQGTNWANHAISVVGWDDNKNMSSVGATIPGAWICKNSWGSNWGENGYFYISYQDRIMNDVLMVFPRRINYNQNAKLYGYDKLGSISGAGYSSTQGYALVKFVGTESHQLTHLSTWVRGANTTVVFEVYDSFNGSTLSNYMGGISQTSCDYAGYHTFELPTPIMLTQGNDIYIKVMYLTPSTYYPIPIERVSSNYAYPTIESGVAWISSNGSNWLPIGSNTSNAWDLCIRAYGVSSNQLVLSPPTLSFPANNATNVSLTTLLDWNDVPNATGYELQLSASSDFQNPIINLNNLTSSEYNVPANTLNFNTTYYWRVRTQRNSELSTWSSRQFTTMNNLTPPTIIMPANLAEDVSSNPTFSWSNVPGAENYDLNVSLSSNFDILVINATNLLSTQFNYNGTPLLNNTIYYWRVRAKSGGLNSSWRNAEFTTGSPINPPQLIAPTSNEQNVPLYATMDWSDVNGAVAYDLQICTSQDFSNPVLNIQNCSISQYSLNSNTLSSNTQYHWRVRTKNNSNSSDWAQSTFSTISSLTAPTLISPADRSSNVSVQPLLDWSDASGAQSYKIQISPRSNFSEIFYEKSGINESQLSLTEVILNNSTYYYWRVKSCSNNSESDWSSAFYFYTESLRAPTMLSPSHNAKDVPTSVTLDWSDVLGADYYFLQVAKDNNFRNLVINLNNLTTSEYEIPSGVLNRNTTYYWKVKTKRGSTESVWASRWFFKTGTLNGPSLRSPSNLATGTSLSPTLDWESVSGADSYEVEVSIASNFSSIVVSCSNLTECSYNVPSGNLVANRRYYWRARYKTGNEYSDWSSWSFTTKQLSNGPTLVSPSSWSTNNPINPTLDWQDLQGASKYKIQISLSSNYTNIVYENDNITGSQLTVPNDQLSYGTYYSWRVAALVDNEWTNWSASWIFRVKVVPTTSLSSPSWRATNVSLTPTLSWASVSEADSYILELSDSYGFTTTIISESGITSNSFNVQSGRLNYGTTYYWRVKVVARNQESNWSSIYQFTTRQAKSGTVDYASETKETENYIIDVYPNPTTDVLNIQANFGTKVGVRILLSDISGKVLLNFDAGKVSQYNDQFYLHSLPAGMYILRIIANNNEIIKKVVKH